MEHIKGPCDPIADLWESWCGETLWSKKLKEFGRLGGKITYYCGMPRSASAIPLCFVLHLPNGKEFNGRSRLKDIQQAISKAKGE